MVSGVGMDLIHRCPKCNSAMIRADLYDPEGASPLCCHDDGDYSWCCINGGCDDGRKNGSVAQW